MPGVWDTVGAEIRSQFVTMLARLARLSARSATPSAPAMMRETTRHMAMGPAAGGKVSDEMLAKLSTLSTQVRAHASTSRPH